MARLIQRLFFLPLSFSALLNGPLGTLTLVEVLVVKEEVRAGGSCLSVNQVFASADRQLLDTVVASFFLSILRTYGRLWSGTMNATRKLGDLCKNGRNT